MTKTQIKDKRKKPKQKRFSSKRVMTFQMQPLLTEGLYKYVLSVTDNISDYFRKLIMEKEQIDINGKKLA